MGAEASFQVKAMSRAVTGLPSPHIRPGLSLMVTFMPLVPSGRSSMAARPFSSDGSSAQSRQTGCQSLSKALTWRWVKERA